ncbi:MAG: hypothetical protein M5U28_27180 [Sandaracinaceae bacterium]|nr:hypothetical protein [Sandaracinaceae bacterium]
MTREQKIAFCEALSVEIPPLDAPDFAAQLASQLAMARSRLANLEAAERHDRAAGPFGERALSSRDRARLRGARAVLAAGSTST